MFIQRNTFSESLLKVDEPLYKVYHDSTLYGDGTRANPLKVIGGGGTSLPDQTGNIGKYLTTDGSVASWATVAILPSQTGNDGKYLTTNGVTASWTSTVLTDAKQTISVISGTRTIDFSLGNIVDLTVNVSALTLTFINPSITTYVIKITNNSGTLNITWPVNVKWSGGVPPSITQVSGKIDIVTLVYDGTNYYASYMLNF